MNALASFERPADPIAHSGGGSSVEAMAKTRHDRLQRGRNAVAWDQAHPDYRDQMMREAAADLVILTELILPVPRQWLSRNGGEWPPRHSGAIRSRTAVARCRSATLRSRRGRSCAPRDAFRRPQRAGSPACHDVPRPR